jgi:hypothetical protein
MECDHHFIEKSFHSAVIDRFQGNNFVANIGDFFAAAFRQADK